MSAQRSCRAALSKLRLMMAANMESGMVYNVPRAGSRKASVHEIYKTEGVAAAFAKANELGIKEHSARLWLRTWGADSEELKRGKSSKAKAAGKANKAKAADKQPANKTSTKKKQDDEPAARVGFEPYFKYTSRNEAERVARGREKTSGMEVGALEVAYHNGRYAVVPRHYYLRGREMPQFEVGCRVRNMVGSWEGVIKEAGKEQSLVAYDNGINQYVCNHYVVKLEPKPDAIKSAPVASKTEATSKATSKAKPPSKSKTKAKAKPKKK